MAKVNSGIGQGQPRWKYLDNLNNEHFGWIEKTVDLGGTDVTYFFRDENTNELSIVRGSRLKQAKRVWS